MRTFAHFHVTCNVLCQGQGQRQKVNGQKYVSSAATLSEHKKEKQKQHLLFLLQQIHAENTQARKYLEKKTLPHKRDLHRRVPQKVGYLKLSLFVLH